MIKIFKKLIVSKVGKNASYLTIGNIISQIISLIGAFYIPKFLGAEGYGIYNTVVAFTSLFLVFTLNGFDKTLIREMSRNLNNAKQILENTIAIKNIASILAATICIITAIFIDYNTALKLYIMIYSSFLLFKGFHLTFETVFQAFQNMKILGSLSIIRQLIRVPLAIFLLKLGYGILSLIVIDLSIELLVTIFLYHQSNKFIKFNLLSKFKFDKKVFFSGIRFSLLKFLNVLTGKVDIVMLSFLTTSSEVGIYALAFRLVNKVLVIRDPIVKSIFPHYSKNFNKILNKSILIKHSSMLFVLTSFIVVVAILSGKILINTIIGPQFNQSIEIFNILMVYTLFNFVGIPFSTAIQSTGHEKLSLITVTIVGITNIALNYFFFVEYGLIGIAYSTLLIEFLRLLLNVFITYKIKNNSSGLICF